MKVASSAAALAAGAACALLALAAPGRATVRMQEEAKELGYPADDCAYCHSFTREHMTRHAREAGLRTPNCVYCHGDALPLDGLDLYNARGRFLLDVKAERAAKRCQMRWLEDYVEEDVGDDVGDDVADEPGR